MTRERASDSAFQALRDGILTQLFKPGERLNIPDLAARLDVSLTPVKEALNRLEAEGLVRIRPRSGTFVAELSPEDVAETFEIRRALECLAAERAIAHLTPEVLDRFRSIVRDLERPVAAEADRALHEQTNVQFHSLLVQLSGNRRLAEMYAELNAHVTIARIHHRREDWAQRLDRVRQEHRAILKALEARSVEGLVQALRQHIQRASDSLVEDLRRKAAIAPLAGSGRR
ncbi:MAG: GntR family transcriptional regulator [Acidobacteria bacterium]|nr:GntR family transcriptional regulator [Acidobacteriota bacterium]